MPQVRVEVGTSVWKRVREAVIVGVIVNSVSGGVGVDDEGLSGEIWDEAVGVTRRTRIGVG